MRKDLFSENKNVVDVLFYFDGKDQYARPIRLRWDEQEFDLGGVQFWYTEHRSDGLVHHYTIGDIDGNYTFRLALETENLTWKLEKATRKTQKSVEAISQKLVGALS